MFQTTNQYMYLMSAKIKHGNTERAHIISDLNYMPLIMFDYTHISHLPENNITTMENHNFQQVHHERKRATTSSSQSVSVPNMYTGQQHP